MELLSVEFEEECLVRTRRAVLACARDQGAPDERLWDFLAAVNECVVVSYQELPSDLQGKMRKAGARHDHSIRIP
ncbi:hypothetical protein ACTMTI_47960 [Nonomuraea sp. H19]|uniref:hypothetical protein n=1 Tax=Nonomuraea sp. H19 TaxID=3452206 RepID=UPI003F8B322E